jgi:RNA polymerase sigma-70 factor (ECF subfamily)
VVQNCLGRLSAAHREIIDLVYYHEKTVEEAAVIVGIPANTVKTRMFYARSRMRELLESAGIDSSF